MTEELRAALDPVADALESLGIEYRIGGSVASSALGVARSSLDVDLVADLRDEHVGAFVARLERDYYADAEMIREAIRGRDCFNLIHLATMMKIDVFVVKRRAFDRQAFSRVVRETLSSEPGARVFPLTTAEDIIVHKLEWFGCRSSCVTPPPPSEHRVEGLAFVSGAGCGRRCRSSWPGPDRERGRRRRPSRR